LWNGFPTQTSTFQLEGTVKTSIQNGLAAAAVALMCFGAVACGSGVSGHTYADNEGMVKIQFQSGGKANATIGPLTAACTYTQSGKQVMLTCENQTTQFTVGDDGSLTGPPDGMMNKLTKVK
jgi:hypothetical protein